MPSQQQKFRDRFDPAQWSAIYDSQPDAAHFAFLRSADVARSECNSFSAAGQLWLDAGCGTGHLDYDLSNSGLRTIGLDHDREMIAAAVKRFAQLQFLNASASQLPFASDQLDGVVAVSLMGCLDSPEVFYRESRRVLKKNGILILTCTNRASLLLKFSAMLRSATTSDRFHLYSASEIKNGLSAQGFTIEKVAFYNFFLNPGQKILPSRALARRLDWFSAVPLSPIAGRNFVVVARKI
ncbi:MAG TPA: class I SAM-dependent methyltransferase [Acidobacteriota bacterium]|nr:class I SAM-dependent methyltransferase [Acidobacteriota bacterium]